MKKEKESKKEPAKEVPHKPKMTISYAPAPIEVGVGELMHSMVEKYDPKILLKQLAVCTYYEGPAQCTMILALKTKEEGEQIVKNVDASNALAYLLRNWDHCVAEGKKITDNIGKN